MNASDRGRLLNKLADLIEQNQEELAALETLDNGKPYRDSFHIDLPATVKHTFDVGGPDTITMTALVDLIRAVTGKRRVLKIHVPVRFLRMVAQLFQPFPSFPITPDQLLMLEANNTCDPAAFFTTFGLTPVALRAGLARMLD